MAIETAVLRRNLSRVELGLAVLIIGVLFAIFMNRVTEVEAAAEKAILRATYQDMQSRLLTLKVSLVFQENRAQPIKLNDIARHLGRGTLPLLDSESLVNWEDVPRGSWMYFKDTQLVEYRVINEDYFDVGKAAPKRVRFRLEPHYVDINGNGRYDESEDHLNGAALRLLDKEVFSNVR
jgi:hypothetical protein